LGAQPVGAKVSDAHRRREALDMAWSACSARRSKLGRTKEGRMSDPNSLLATLAIAIVVFTCATVVLSRIIPDDYDRRAPVRRRATSNAIRRHR
jgi:hypothetical protein